MYAKEIRKNGPREAGKCQQRPPSDGDKRQSIVPQNEVPHELGRLWTPTGDQETCWMREHAVYHGQEVRTRADGDCARPDVGGGYVNCFGRSRK